MENLQNKQFWDYGTRTHNNDVGQQDYFLK